MPSFLLSLAAIGSGEGIVLSALGGGEEMAEPEQLGSIYSMSTRNRPETGKQVTGQVTGNSQTVLTSAISFLKGLFHVKLTLVLLLFKVISFWPFPRVNG